jgi:hypothetical protein
LLLCLMYTPIYPRTQTTDREFETHEAFNPTNEHVRNPNLASNLSESDF